MFYLSDDIRRGVCCQLRFAPVDYHGFRFVGDGVCAFVREFGSIYCSVILGVPMKVPLLFCRNYQNVSVLESARLSRVIYMEIGAFSVGLIVQRYEPDARVLRGAEKSCFKFGGSTVLLFLKKGRVSIDADILCQSSKDIECLVVRAGE